MSHSVTVMRVPPESEVEVPYPQGYSLASNRSTIEELEAMTAGRRTNDIDAPGAGHPRDHRISDSGSKLGTAIRQTEFV